MSAQNKQTYRYLMSGISIALDEGEEVALNRAARQMKRLGVQAPSLHFRLYKRSVDARKKQDIRLVWTVMIECGEPLSPSVCQKGGLRRLEDLVIEAPVGEEIMPEPPLVVGMGPAGLFAALTLAQNGYRPILIDRGGDVTERVAAVEKFRETGCLDTDCNIQFGAGGAGTFSDGKLVTRIHDARCRTVLNTFYQFGAPEEILKLAKPHIGTDVLRGVVSSMLEEISRLGGRVIYRCRLIDFEERGDGTLTAHTTAGDFSCGALILAIGHSARDTYKTLISKQYAVEPKPISMGVRAEHLQEDIDRSMFGEFAGHPALGHGEYSLSDTKTERGVYTFCMCPGGEVVAAASEQEGLVVNGMSNHARDGKNANAAVLVSVGCDDYAPVDGNRALGAIAFQRSVEKKAFVAGGGDYYAPVMTLGDFMAGKRGSEPSRVQPSYRDGRVRTADFETVFPSFVTESLRYAFRSFGKSLAGYDAADTVLTAAETRTSAPVRILRNNETCTALGHPLVYPCGEGAGYAGGITSAATDGIRIAEAVMKRFAPIEK